MKITRANVEAYAKNEGLELIEKEGIVEGFAWKEPDLTIGGKTHKGRIVIFKPLAEWGDKDSIIYE